MPYFQKPDHRSTLHGEHAGSTFVQRHAPLLIGAGAALAAMAAYVQHRTRQVEQHNPPAGKFIEVNGIRLHYLERGQGQPIVLLHGNGTMAQELEISGVLDLASEKYRVIVFDRPGYGYSDRPRTTIWTPAAQARLLYQALQQLGIQRPVIAGHSWGAMVAIALGLEYPDYVRSLLLISGYYYPTPRLDVPLLSPPAIPVIGDLMRYTLSPLLGRALWPAMLRKLFSPAKIPARFTEEYPVWMGLRPSQLRAGSAEGLLMIPAAYKLSARYHELSMPVIIMAGESDLHALPKLHAKRLHKALPDSELIMVPDVGHMLQQNAPHLVAAAIDKAAQADDSPEVFAQRHADSQKRASALI